MRAGIVSVIPAGPMVGAPVGRPVGSGALVAAAGSGVSGLPWITNRAAKTPRPAHTARARQPATIEIATSRPRDRSGAGGAAWAGLG
jgi:hypothetical protein